MRVLVEDRLSGLEDLAVERLDLVRQLVPVDVPECPAEVFVRREAVHPGQRLVHADVAKGRVHERHADWSRRENGVEDGERLARLQPRGIRSPEEQRVVDRDRGVTREIQCGRELGLSVSTPALREDEGDRAESPISRDERHAQGRLEAELLQDLAQFRPGGDRIGDQLLRDLAEELRLERADDIRYAVGGVRVGGILLGQLVRPSHLVRIDVRNGQALDRAVPRDHVDCAPVGEPGHRESGHVRQGRLVVERGGEELARFRDERPVGSQLPLLLVERGRTHCGRGEVREQQRRAFLRLRQDPPRAVVERQRAEDALAVAERERHHRARAFGGVRAAVLRGEPFRRRDVLRDDRSVEWDCRALAADRLDGAGDVLCGQTCVRGDVPGIGCFVVVPEGVGIGGERPLGEVEHLRQHRLDFERPEDGRRGFE